MFLTASALFIALAAGAVGLWLLLTQSPVLTLGDPITPDSDDGASHGAIQEAYDAAIAPVLDGQTLAAFVRRKLIVSVIGFLLLLLSIGMLAGIALLLQERT